MSNVRPHMHPFLSSLAFSLLSGAVVVLFFGFLLGLALAICRRMDRIPQVLFITVGGATPTFVFAGLAWFTLNVLEVPPSTALVSTLNLLALGSLLATVVAVVKTARGTLSLAGKFPFVWPFATTLGQRSGQHLTDK
jgi:ABC-type xylose transport system permease subunit